MDEGLRQVVALLAVAMMVAIVARRFRLPYTVGLVLIGAVLTFGGLDLGQHLTHDLIFDLILPPLLFEAALSLHWRELRRDFPPILVFSTLGSILSAAAVAVAMTAFMRWPLASALVFGSLIAATDPVAIIAMFKDNKIGGRLRLLVESESLLNDGAAAVLFGLSLEWAQSGGMGWTTLGVSATLARVVIGGVAIGGICGGLAILVAGRLSDHLIEAALTTVAAFGSFLIADYFNASGVLATVTAGLIIGNLGVLAHEKSAFLSVKGREFIISFWEFAAFFVNSVVFLLIGADSAQALVKSYGASTLLGRQASRWLDARSPSIRSASSSERRGGRFHWRSNMSSGGEACAALCRSPSRCPSLRRFPCATTSSSSPSPSSPFQPSCRGSRCRRCCA